MKIEELKVGEKLTGDSIPPEILENLSPVQKREIEFLKNPPFETVGYILQRIGKAEYRLTCEYNYIHNSNICLNQYFQRQTWIVSL